MLLLLSRWAINDFNLQIFKIVDKLGLWFFAKAKRHWKGNGLKTKILGQSCLLG